MIITNGIYIGNGSAGHAIATDNDPDFVIVKARDVSAIGAAVAKTATMGTDFAKDLDSNSTALESGLITLTGTGFTTGTDVRVNSNGVVYHYLAIQAVGSDTEFEVGSYAGNGSDNRNISLATITGTPGIVMIFGDFAAGAFWRSNVHSGDLSQWFSSIAAATTNGIQSFGAGTFQVGTRDQVNHGAGTPTYHYVAIMEVASKMEVVSYTGNGADNRSITGAGFRPNWAMVQARDSNARGMVLRGPAHVGDQTSFISSTGDITDHIQDFESDGIQIGTNARVNQNGELFTALFFEAPIRQAITTTIKKVTANIQMAPPISTDPNEVWIETWEEQDP